MIFASAYRAQSLHVSTSHHIIPTTHNVPKYYTEHPFFWTNNWRKNWPQNILFPEWTIRTTPHEECYNLPLSKVDPFIYFNYLITTNFISFLKTKFFLHVENFNSYRSKTLIWYFSCGWMLPKQAKSLSLILPCIR